MQLYFAPHCPEMIAYALAGILYRLNYTATLTSETVFDAAVLWEDKTFVEVPDILREIAETKPVLNIGCIDISKRRVEQALRDICGLSTLVDPTTFHGKCIKKPDGNAIRNGIVVDCPLPAAEDGWVYQKIVDTRVDGVQVEFRTPVILGEIPAVYVTRRDYPVGDINDCQRRGRTLAAPSEIYTPDEVERLLAFSNEIGMDLGELDVLRSLDDGQLYIIDANKTAAGYGIRNRASWLPGDRDRAMALLADAFERNLAARLSRYRQ